MSKNDSEKWEPTLVYTSFLKEIARVRKYGAQKYGSTEDWRTTPPTNHFNAIFRHLNAHLDGELFDQESGFMHLAHAAATLMMEIERWYSAQELDDVEVEVTCPRCGSTDIYPLNMINVCANGCRCIIDPMLMFDREARPFKSPPPTQTMIDDDLVRKEKLCVICHKNPVDVEHGFDTCDECVGKIRK